MLRTYKIEQGGLHDRFQSSRKKIQIFGGGFGNGKTTAAVIKALTLAKDYPGSNGLIARSTYPKLNSTIRKEFVAWCPKSWIQRDVNSKDNLIELKNGTTINFSHIMQGGKQAESSTSNLLSATYDWIVVDQVEDPEITEKDFDDLMGRLRGQATYQGDDETMPSSGPRWMILMCNPTRNWVYRRLVKPIQDQLNGIPNPLSLIDEQSGESIVELFEGSTYENRNNLPDDFIRGLETTYKGQMRNRFLLGEWGAYEGLVYPQYDPNIHVVDHNKMMEYYDDLCARGFIPTLLEAYDHGIASPACYGIGFVDDNNIVFLLSGFHEKEKTVKELAKNIKRTREQFGIDTGDTENPPKVLADPSIFRRTTGNSRTVGTTVSGMFREEQVIMVRGNNDILNGIAKVQSYLSVDDALINPFTDGVGSPRLFFSNQCNWVDREIVDYYWKKDSGGEYEDTPTDRNDHAMDMLKYMLTNRPRVAIRIVQRPSVPPKYLGWREREGASLDVRNHRYA